MWNLNQKVAYMGKRCMEQGFKPLVNDTELRQKLAEHREDLLCEIIAAVQHDLLRCYNVDGQADVIFEAYDEKYSAPETEKIGDWFAKGVNCFQGCSTDRRFNKALYDFFDSIQRQLNTLDFIIVLKPIQISRQALRFSFCMYYNWAKVRQMLERKAPSEVVDTILEFTGRDLPVVEQ